MMSCWRHHLSQDVILKVINNKIHINSATRDRRLLFAHWVGINQVFILFHVHDLTWPLLPVDTGSAVLLKKSVSGNGGQLNKYNDDVTICNSALKFSLLIWKWYKRNSYAQMQSCLVIVYTFLKQSLGFEKLILLTRKKLTYWAVISCVGIVTVTIKATNNLMTRSSIHTWLRWTYI